MLRWSQTGCTMSKCKKCNIEILDQTDHCPFCHMVLEKANGAERNAYPDARVAVKRFRLASNILLFLSIVTAIFLLFLEYYISGKFGWSLIVLLSLIYANVIMRLAIVGKSSYQFKVLSLTIIAIVILVGIDFVSGYRGWAVNYVLPCAIAGVDISILILMITNHRNWQAYMVPQIVMLLLSIIPLVLCLTEIIYAPIFSVIAFGCSLFEFLGTLIIGDDRARTELKRRFHF